ncbi:MAG TPA: thioredoxin domain-containing protein [Bacteroidales bacterium]|nr:thioredoxin domain-containing protein [Bacteroidales bacterium]
MMKNKIVQLNYPDFDSFIRENSVLIDFWAEWCHPCKAQHEMLKEISLQFDHLISFATVNVDDNKVIATKYGVSNLPSLLLFINGKEVRRFIGLQNKDFLISQIDRYLNKKNHKYDSAHMGE